MFWIRSSRNGICFDIEIFIFFRLPDSIFRIGIYFDIEIFIFWKFGIYNR